ncbi:hypothetical protein BC832DRAFT_565319 [Gaertneriomyces semiglobifer]|nr:hypothetical protein BC832DRAFT_565319 [Gaertneriomyces semiglobifer]
MEKNDAFRNYLVESILRDLNVLVSQGYAANVDAAYALVKGPAGKPAFGTTAAVSRAPVDTKSAAPDPPAYAQSQAYAYQSSADTKRSAYTATVLYDYHGQEPGDLTLRAGDVVSDLEVIDENWYKGTIRRPGAGPAVGIFPRNYVKTDAPVVPRGGPSLPPRRAAANSVDRPVQEPAAEAKPSKAQRFGDNVITTGSHAVGWGFGAAVGRNLANSLF